jgi:hypothetical protein
VLGIAGLVAVLVIANSGDDTSTAPTTTARPASTEPEPSTTDVVSTTVETTTTVAPTTLVPTTTVAVATDAALRAVVPTATDVPADWIWPEGDPVWSGFSPASGPYRGFCGGDSGDARALASGATAIVGLDWIELPTGGWYTLAVVGFDSPASATEFVNRTRTQASSCPEGFAYSMPEGSGEGQFDGFSDGDPAVTWTMSDHSYVADSVTTGVDETVHVVWITAFSTVDGSDSYSGVETEVFRFERVGAIVMIHRLDSWHDFVGFGSGGGSYVASPEDLTPLADALRAGLIQRLGDRHLV